LGQFGELDAARRSPVSGLPLDCCRIVSMPVLSSTDADASAKRR
jgi:hypothetical protein